jgi:DNA (cytosine-5)-methyltransferase 1
MNKLRVIELFAGVGGFRLGLEGWNGKSAISQYKKPLSKHFKVVWSNQYEPSTNTQHANIIYKKRFGDKNHSEDNISNIKGADLPIHDVLVGGFPCQDYSVANSLRTAKGILGKKGVLWWEIERLLKELGDNKPKYLILENVDRLLKSPVEQRGKDFAVMLASLNAHGYVVEWRVINAADLGFPQKRKRVFIIAYLGESNRDIFSKKFKHNDIKKEARFNIEGSLENISNNFGTFDKVSKFLNSGVCINRTVTTQQIEYSKPTKPQFLRDFIEQNTSKIDDDFWIESDNILKWKETKKGKKIPRTSKLNGHQYMFSEGSMSFPDKLDAPARTIITSEGGNSPSRFKHVIEHNGRYRRLTPVELERLNMFPDNHTGVDSIVNSKRAFLMGNALVVGVIEMIGQAIYSDAKSNP